MGEKAPPAVGENSPPLVLRFRWEGDMFGERVGEGGRYCGATPPYPALGLRGESPPLVALSPPTGPHRACSLTVTRFKYMYRPT